MVSSLSNKLYTMRGRELKAVELALKNAELDKGTEHTETSIQVRTCQPQRATPLLTSTVLSQALKDTGVFFQRWRRLLPRDIDTVDVMRRGFKDWCADVRSKPRLARFGFDAQAVQNADTLKHITDVTDTSCPVISPLRKSQRSRHHLPEHIVHRGEKV